MAFKEEVKYGSVTLDFIIECAKVMKLDPNKKETLRMVLHSIGFEVSVLNEDTGEYVPCRIDRMNNVNVRCPSEPYKCRPTTVFSGRLRKSREFPLVSLYEKFDILDSNKAIAAALVNSMAFDIPTGEKVNTRKYTKKEDRSHVLIMDIPDVGSLEDNLLSMN